MGWYPKKVDVSSTVSLSEAELTRIDNITPGTMTAGKALVPTTGGVINALDITALKIGGVALGSSAAQIDAAVAGTPLIYRATISAALVSAGATAIVPAVAGKRFQVLSLQMRSNGGTVTGPTTVGIKEDGGAIFLSQAVAGLTDAVWHNTITGTPVITGMTSGGMTAVANKGLLAYCAGGDTTVAGAGVTGLSFIVCGYYTTT